MFQKEIISAALILLLLYPCVSALAGNGRVFKALNDHFNIFADLKPCTGQTMCLCYRTDEQIQYLRTRTPSISILCPSQTDAFVCAKHKITSPQNSESGTHEVIIATSAMKETVKLDGKIMLPTAFNVYFDIAEKSAKIGLSPKYTISSFANLHYKSLNKRVVKLYLSSCWSNIQIGVQNLEEVEEEFDTQNNSIWEVVMSYLYDTGSKSLDVAQSTLAILAGVLKVDLETAKNLITTTPPPTEIWNTTTEEYNSTQSEITETWTTEESNTTETEFNETTTITAPHVTPLA
uniref:CBM49 domain-containing protein n=1 Tax=Panagrellus redivivus TaxID=6233 RepID=A0A7E4V1S6_PANRE